MCSRRKRILIRVFPTYASAFRQVLVDGGLYLPKEWTQGCPPHLRKERWTADVLIPDQCYPDRQYQADSLILRVNLFQCHKMPCSIQGFQLNIGNTAHLDVV